MAKLLSYEHDIGHCNSKCTGHGRINTVTKTVQLGYALVALYYGECVILHGSLFVYLISACLTNIGPPSLQRLIWVYNTVGYT